MNDIPMIIPIPDDAMFKDAMGVLKQAEESFWRECEKAMQIPAQMFEVEFSNGTYSQIMTMTAKGYPKR